MTAKVAIVVLLLSALAAAIFAGCGGIAGSIVGNAPATNPAAQPPPPAVATAVAQAEATVQASYAKSGADYCGRLCQPTFWLDASVADLDAEIGKGADVNARDDGVRGAAPLHYAVPNADLSVIAALLDRGADLEAKDDHGFTALHIIVWPPGYIGVYDPDAHRHSGHDLEVAALLLERGADANAQSDRSGHSPAYYANDPVMAVLLLNYGADRETVCETRRLSRRPTPVPPTPVPTPTPQPGITPPMPTPDQTPTPYPTPTYTPIEALVCP